MIDAAIYLVGVAAGAYLGVLADRRLRRRRAIRRLRADLAAAAGPPPPPPPPAAGTLGLTASTSLMMMAIQLDPSPAAFANPIPIRPAPWVHRPMMVLDRHCMN